MKRIGIGAGLAAAALALMALPAAAEDSFKMAIGQINNWENQAPTLGQDAGFFKKHGIVLENFGTAGAGETVQAVISGSADLGGGVGVAGVLRAMAKGAPVRIIAPAFTGWIMQGLSLTTPFFLGGGLKIVYDLLLYNTIRNVRTR